MSAHSLPLGCCILIPLCDRNLLRINDQRLNAKLDTERTHSVEVGERQDASIEELKELAKENNRLIEIATLASDRIFGALRLEWLRSLGSELQALMQRTYSMNVVIYDGIRSLQGLLPSHLERTLIEEPFIPEDAVGRLAPVHLQFICSWEAFEDVLEHRFRDFQGVWFQRSWILQELATSRDISRNTPWNRAFLPGQKIGMDMIFWTHESHDVQDTSCPNCQAPAAGSLERGISGRPSTQSPFVEC